MIGVGSSLQQVGTQKLYTTQNILEHSYYYADAGFKTRKGKPKDSLA